MSVNKTNRLEIYQLATALTHEIDFEPHSIYSGSVNVFNVLTFADILWGLISNNKYATKNIV